MNGTMNGVGGMIPDGGGVAMDYTTIALSNDQIYQQSQQQHSSDLSPAAANRHSYAVSMEDSTTPMLHHTIIPSASSSSSSSHPPPLNNWNHSHPHPHHQIHQVNGLSSSSSAAASLSSSSSSPVLVTPQRIAAQHHYVPHMQNNNQNNVATTGLYTSEAHPHHPPHQLLLHPQQQQSSFNSYPMQQQQQQQHPIHTQLHSQHEYTSIAAAAPASPGHHHSSTYYYNNDTHHHPSATTTATATNTVSGTMFDFDTLAPFHSYPHLSFRLPQKFVDAWMEQLKREAEQKREATLAMSVQNHHANRQHDHNSVVVSPAEAAAAAAASMEQDSNSSIGSPHSSAHHLLASTSAPPLLTNTTTTNNGTTASSSSVSFSPSFDGSSQVTEAPNWGRGADGQKWKKIKQKQQQQQQQQQQHTNGIDQNGAATTSPDSIVYSNRFHISFRAIHRSDLIHVASLHDSLFPVKYDQRFYNQLLQTDTATILAFVEDALPNQDTSSDPSSVSSSFLPTFPLLVGVATGRAKEDTYHTTSSTGTSILIASGCMRTKYLGYISTLGVIPSFRRVGLGHFLLKQICLMIREMETRIEGIVLHVKEDNAAAVKMYVEKEGFMIWEKLINHYTIENKQYHALKLMKYVTKRNKANRKEYVAMYEDDDHEDEEEEQDQTKRKWCSIQ